jgi:HEAT repeat protein
MVSILGELRCSECIPELKRPLYHEDVRVRKEAIRALMKIGGEAAESALIPLLEEQDEGLVRHVILSLGLMRSRQAVPGLLKLLERRDLLLKGLEVKKELLLALGRIGDRRSTGHLLKMLVPRGWPVLGRWLELKIAVAAALGVLGDEAALPAVTALAAGTGALAEACREAQDAIERVSGGIHD